MFATPLHERLPAGVDRMAPGPDLGRALAAVDVERLSGHDQVVVLAAHQRMASHYQAQVCRDMVAVAATCAAEDDNPEFAFDAASAEIASALRLTRRAADRELSIALEMVQKLPRVWRWLARGTLDARRARAIVHGTGHLAAAAARRVVDRLAEAAPDLTTGQLLARIRKLAIEADPDEARQRYETAVAGRRVVAEPTVDGTANLLCLDVEPQRVAAARSHVDRLARSLRGPGETRTMDQLRADVTLDLLAGRPVGARTQATVEIHVDLDTLAGLADRPAEVGGYGPVIADVARQVAENQPARWRFVVTDPTTGDPVHVGVTRRRPTTAQRRQIHARYRTCVFPGCRMPAVDGDLDHRIPWAQGGSTTIHDLAPLCRYHHRVRHGAGWSYERLGNGDHRWASPLGRSYVVPTRPP